MKITFYPKRSWEFAAMAGAVALFIHMYSYVLEPGALRIRGEMPRHDVEWLAAEWTLLAALEGFAFGSIYCRSKLERDRLTIAHVAINQTQYVVERPQLPRPIEVEVLPPQRGYRQLPR